MENNLNRITAVLGPTNTGKGCWIVVSGPVRGSPFGLSRKKPTFAKVIILLCFENHADFLVFQNRLFFRLFFRLFTDYFFDYLLIIFSIIFRDRPCLLEV